MEYTILASEDFHPVSWSGGTTTELFIFPRAAVYQERNFQFRLSTATVVTDESDFTTLNGFSRKLMVLDGKITLYHEGHYRRHLNKFDTDEFEGSWKTSSRGKCTDFNLMTSGSTTGDLTAKIIEKDNHAVFNVRENCEWFFIYLYSGEVRIIMNDKIAILNKGDLLVLNKPAIGSYEITGIEFSEMVFVEIPGLL